MLNAPEGKKAEKNTRYCVFRGGGDPWGRFVPSYLEAARGPNSNEKPFDKKESVPALVF